MTKYISQVNLDLFGENKQINFRSGLNIVSGTNGTGKTKLLQFIQNNNGNANVLNNEGTNDARIIAFSPQRNAQKHLAQQALDFYRLDRNATETALGIFRTGILDDGFQTIKSISEYFVYLAEDTVKTADLRPSESTSQVKTNFEISLKKVFNFDIEFELNKETKSYDLFFIKDEISLTPQQLSHGENAIIVLICALIFSKDSSDTILIDEPEIHLNWSLEEKLFKFFDWFCSEFDRQIIVVTHSRVAFLEDYVTKRQFFERNGQDIIISEKPSDELIRQLAGDTVQLLQGITTKNKLVYVEDSGHQIVLKAICEKLNLDVEILVGGNSEKVKILSRAFKDRGIENVYFLIDGDNKPLTTDEKRELHNNTIQLEKYCLENYLLNPALLQLYKQQDWDTVLTSFINAMNVRATPAIKPIQIAINNGTSLNDILDYIDGSEIFKRLVEHEGKKDEKYEFMKELVNLIPPNDIFAIYFAEMTFLKDASFAAYSSNTSP